MKAIEKLKALVSTENLTTEQLSVSANGKILPHEEAVAIGHRVLERIESESYSRLTVQKTGNQTRITLAEQDGYFILAMAN